jgi:hypothetical protein
MFAINIALIVRVVTIVAQVVQELWQGPLGELIRELMHKAPNAFA